MIGRSASAKVEPTLQVSLVSPYLEKESVDESDEDERDV